MKCPEISLIVPFYKNKQTIDVTLTSLFRALKNIDQSLIQIIFVNNNSTDGTEKKIQKFLKCVPQALLINEFQQGVSHARNRGVAYCSGSYVAFLDADDELDPRYFSQILRAVSTKPDLVMVKHQLFGILDSDIVCSPSVLIKSHLHGWWNWQFIFRKTLASDFKFHGHCYEDFGYFPFIVNSARNCIILGEKLYHYKNNISSITKSNPVELCLQFQNQFYMLCERSNELEPDTFKRVQVDFYDGVTLLRAMAGQFPLLSLKDAVIYFPLIISSGRSIDLLINLLYRNLSVLYRPIKKILFSRNIF